MEAIKLTCYKNWSIKIECERYDHDARRPTYAAIAIVTYVRQNYSGTLTNCPECFIVSLPGELFYDSHTANLAVQQEAMRRIDALPIPLPAMLAAKVNCSK